MKTFRGGSPPRVCSQLLPLSVECSAPSRVASHSEPSPACVRLYRPVTYLGTTISLQVLPSSCERYACLGASSATEPSDRLLTAMNSFSPSTIEPYHLRPWSLLMNRPSVVAAYQVSPSISNARVRGVSSTGIACSAGALCATA